MSKLVWDKEGEHRYETGVKNCALYVHDGQNYGTGVPWNGITGITESPSGAEANPLYADDTKYLNLYSVEEIGATVEAYTYPDEFAECDGSASIATGVNIGQQARKTFGLAYKTVVGNDTEANDYGTKIHILYGCKASPSEKAYATINDSPVAITFSWELTTTPVEVTGYKKTASVTIDTTKFSTPELKKKLQTLEDKLFGSETEEPTLLMPDEIIALIGKNVVSG